MGTWNRSDDHPPPPANPSPWYTDYGTLLTHFQKSKLAGYTSGSPSADHLLCLIQFNVLRGFDIIMHVLGTTPEQMMNENSISPFTSAVPSRCDSAHGMALCYPPGNLSPTVLQTTIPHHPWLDTLPFPRMRDNLLRIGSGSNMNDTVTYDPDDLCHWMIGIDPDQREGGLILWGDPWDPTSWEVTTEFVSRWGWALKGCTQLFMSTNYWRRKRGEKPLFSAGQITR